MLTITRPTPTTVLYTVSTRAPAKTLASHASTYLLAIIRILAGTLILTILLREWRPNLSSDSSPSAHVGLFDRILSTLFTSPLDHLSALLAEHMTQPWRLGLCACTTWLILRKFHTEESLLVIRGLGLQTSTSSSSYLWLGGKTRFIPTSSIQDIFLHEAFKGFEVRYYLSVVVDGEEDVVVVFPNILPRREILENVWRGTKACLYEPTQPASLPKT